MTIETIRADVNNTGFSAANAGAAASVAQAIKRAWDNSLDMVGLLVKKRHDKAKRVAKQQQIFSFPRRAIRL